MTQLQLEGLENRLLKAGVAYRHVRRFVRELRDHYDDALRDELSKGLSRGAAEENARARIGSDEALANSVLARPELRSVASRFPILVLGIAPVLVWIAALFLGAACFMASIEYFDMGQASQLLFGYAMAIFSLRLLPVVLGIAALTICARQRMRSLWALIGVASVAALSGTVSITLILPAAGQLGELGIGSSLAPVVLRHIAALGRPDGAALAVGLLRGAVMMAVSAAPFLLWRWHQRTRDRFVQE